jgi:hypothetical protein
MRIDDGQGSAGIDGEPGRTVVHSHRHKEMVPGAPAEKYTGLIFACLQAGKSETAEVECEPEDSEIEFVI